MPAVGATLPAVGATLRPVVERRTPAEPRGREPAHAASKAVVVVVAALVGLISATGCVRTRVAAIPPGQEPLLVQMLGAKDALPGGCHLGGASVERTFVAANYVCDGGPAKLELHFHDDGARGALYTERFAVVPRAGVALDAGLLQAIAARVRAREDGFQWLTIGAGGGTATAAGSGGIGTWIAVAATPALAWLVVLVFAGLVLPRLAREHPRDAALFSALVFGSLLLRLAVPWGPLDHAEPQRLQSIWGLHPMINPAFSSVLLPLGAGRLVGLSIATVLRVVGPCFGALGVGFTFLLARAGGLPRGPSLLAACIVAGWPAHLRYSGTALAVPAATLWTAVFAVAASSVLSARWRLALLAAGIVLGVCARPECVLLLVAVVPLVLSPRFSWRERLGLVALVGLGLLPYVLYLGEGQRRVYSELVAPFFRWLVADPAINPWWWIAAALLGLVAGRLMPRLRLGFALAFALLGGVYVVFANEHNPLLGLWRYFVALVPLVAVLAASLLPLAPALARSRIAVFVLCALAFAPVALRPSFVLRPVDLQADFSSVRHSAARIARDHTDLVLIGRDDRPGSFGVECETTLLMAIAAALGPTERLLECNSAPPERGPRVWSVQALLAGCYHGDPAQLAVYLGIYRPPAIVDALRRRFQLVPLEERVVAAAPAIQDLDTQCPIPKGPPSGSALADCSLTLGWYSLVPLPPDGKSDEKAN